MIEITGIRNIDMIIFGFAFFFVLQGLTWIYRKYFKKSKNEIIQGGDLGGNFKN